MDKTPIIEQDLLDYLNELFPNNCPNEMMSDRQIWMAVGSRLVVRKLEQEFEIQNENILS